MGSDRPMMGQPAGVLSKAVRTGHRAERDWHPAREMSSQEVTR